MKITAEFDPARKMWFLSRITGNNPVKPVKRQRRLSFLFGEDVKQLVVRYIDEVEKNRDDEFKRRNGLEAK